MKRIVTALFAIILIFSLFSCSADDSSVKVLSPEETTDKFAFLEKQEVETAYNTTAE